MSEILKIPYEISVWDDELVTLEDGTSYYQEVKKAIIGSDTMTSPSRVFDPVLKENVNGETTLTFSLEFRYFDENVGAIITNPIHPLLINERKVKLYYKDKWYDFIIKECEEDKDENVFTYTAKDIFINELSKQGYNIEFDPELNNNLGTVVELGKEVVKNTDWQVDEEDCDLLQQTIDEPLYSCTATRNFNVINVDDGSTVEIFANDKLYVFYTYISNEEGKFLQFILDKDKENWSYDDNDIIIGTNYRYNGNYEADENSKKIKLDDVESITIGDPYVDHQAYRLVYQQRTLYDPVMEQYVDIYKANYYEDEQEIYKFTTTEYGTSALAIPYITESTNFSSNNGDKITGWDNLNLTSSNQLSELKLASYPPMGVGVKPQSLSSLSGLTSYLRAKFQNTISVQNNKYSNFIFNSGFMDMGATIGNISRGEKFVFRLRAGVGENDAKPVNISYAMEHGGIKAIVAFYTEETKEIDGVKLDLRTFTDKDIILDFDGEFSKTPSIISNGSFNETRDKYIVDNVVQTPSLKYCYQDKDDESKKLYYWDTKKQKYVVWNLSFLNYYSTVTAAKKTVTGKELTDPQVRIGVFIGVTDNFLTQHYVFFEDVQIFKYYEDDNNELILPGNVPLSTAKDKTGYYLKPLEGMTKDDITVYYDKQDLLDELGIEDEDLIGIYNQNCEKILSIKESKSNCFNILQTLCETFECWLKLSVEHEENGAVRLDKSHKPIKRISFKKYVGKENFAGFRYGINLNSITRTIDSNEVVTKLIVADTANEYAEDGNLSIALAESNPTGENVIYNLDYYVQRGLLKNKEQYLKDLGQLYYNVKIANIQLRRLEKEFIKASAALEVATAHANVYTEDREVAQRNYAQALEEFKSIRGQTYETYIQEHPEGFEEGLLDTVGKIYAAANELNNNSGATTTTREEYKKLKLECEGAEEYSITVSTSNGDLNEGGTIPARTKLVISDYIEGFSFAFVKNEDEITYNSSLNDKEFVLESDIPYDILKVTALPENYMLEYVKDGQKIDSETSSVQKFYIYDLENQKERIRRFKLVPNSDYQEKYKGYEKRIQEKIEEKNKYIQDFERKYSQFIQEGTWESSSYIDSNLYYFDALQVSHTSARPQVSYTINVTEVSEIEGLENYNFSIGEKTYIEDVEFFGYTSDRLKEGNDWITFYTPIKEEVILSEIEWHLDDPSENIITIQNYKTQFEDLFQRISATVQSVQYNDSLYTRAAGILDTSGQINSDLLVKSLAQLGSSSYPLVSDGAIEITDDSLIVKDLANQKNYIRLLGRGLQVSTNGGRTWRDVLTADGIRIDSLQAGTIDTQNITIMDGDNTSFRWDKNGLSAYGFDENDGYDLTSFVRMDKYGLYGIKNGDEYVVTSLDDLLEKAHFSLTWDGFRIKNSYGNGYVSISSDNDFEVVKTEPILTNSLNLLSAANNVRKITKVKIGAIEKDEDGTPIKYGININNDEGETVFTTGDDGNITITGTINASAGNIGGFNVTDELSSGDFNQPGSIYLSPNHHGVLYLDGLNEENDWVITAGDNFGVTSDGIMYSNNAVITGTVYATDGEFTGHINAESGNFRGNILVGKTNDKYITINSEGNDPIIASSEYIHNTTAGWMINGTGDAIFNNVSVRGAIKTAVFEYSEIEAVGGAFLFRPSSSIKTARINGDDIILTVEKPQLFKQYEWVKLSNYTGEASSAKNDGGLTHVYKVGNIPATDNYVVLLGAGQDFTSVDVEDLDDLIPQTEDTEDQILDYGQDVEITIDDEEQYYHSRLNDLVLKDNYNYLIRYNRDNCFRQASTTKLTFITYVDALPVFTERNITYIGNLSIIDPNRENSGERFLLATFKNQSQEDITFVYTFEEGTIHLYTKELEIHSNNVAELEGGALISFGYYDNDTQYEGGIHNYGIGINSSDNYVGLPERAISLFESKIHPDRSVKVTYDYKGILGTLPDLGSDLVDRSVFANNMAGTQGIFTNNMYIGDNTQYLAFYTDQNGNKQLKIKANQVVYEVVDEETGETEWHDVSKIETEGTPGPAGEDAIDVRIESNIGNNFIFGNREAVLSCYIYKGTTDITQTVTNFDWVKSDKDGNVVDGWTPVKQGVKDGLLENQIMISTDDVDMKAIFYCNVTFN